MLVEAQDKENVVMNTCSMAKAAPHKLTRAALAATPACKQIDVIREQVMHRLGSMPRFEAVAAADLLLRRDNNEIMTMLDEEGGDALREAAKTTGKAAKTRGRSAGRQRSTSQRLNQGDGMHSSSSRNCGRPSVSFPPKPGKYV